MKYVALIIGGRPSLLLERITRNADGSLKSADVVNGGWRLERRGGEVLAKDYRGSIVTRSPDPGYTEFLVPPEWRGDYNAILCRVREVLA